MLNKISSVIEAVANSLEAKDDIAENMAANKKLLVAIEDLNGALKNLHKSSLAAQEEQDAKTSRNITQFLNSCKSTVVEIVNGNWAGLRKQADILEA